MPVYPVLGKFTITSAYGKRSSVHTAAGQTSTNHTGVDFGGLSDRTVVSVSNGVVGLTKKNHKSYGNLVWIKNSDGTGALYAHLNSFLVSEGQPISAGQKIGIAGSTGKATGVHLHLEIRRSQNYNEYKNFIDPTLYLGLGKSSSLVGKRFDAKSVKNSVIVPIKNTEISTSEFYAGLGDKYYKVDELSSNTKDVLYGRRYRVFVQTDDGNSFDVSELHCTFEINKTYFLEPVSSVLSIYNLSPETENKIIKNGQSIIIEAGYVGTQYGLIFSGEILQVLREKANGTDFILKLVSMDSDRYLKYSLVGTTLVANQSMRDSVEACSKNATVQIEVDKISQLPITYPRGKVLFGMSKEYLNQIANSSNSTFYTSDGKINIVAADSYSDSEIIDLDGTSGLIGTPTQIDYGITFRCLINPSIVIGSRVHIKNDKITTYKYEVGNVVRALDYSSIYKVVKIQIVGDTRSTSWYYNCTAITQVGALPSLMSSPLISPW